MGNSPLVLIVRHGSGRAFPDEFLLHVLEHIGETDPKLRRLLVSHDTGEGEPSLEGVATIVFALRDPLRQRHPDCFAEAEAIAARAEAAGIRVVNSPQALSNTAKSIQARTWAEEETPGGNACGVRQRGRFARTRRWARLPHHAQVEQVASAGGNVRVSRFGRRAQRGWRPRATSSRRGGLVY